MLNRVKLFVAASLFAVAGSAMSAIVYNMELTENGVGDAGPDWFGTVTVDGSTVVAASIAAKGFLLDGLNSPQLPVGFDPVAIYLDAWVLEGLFSDGPQAGLQFWGGTNRLWSFDADCGLGGDCGGLPVFGTYTLTEASVPSPAPLPLVLLGLGALGAAAKRRKSSRAA
jgi:hypothetical protein